MERLKLLLLVWNNVISFEYWWNYDYSDRCIFVMNDIDSEDIASKLDFGKELQLIGEDLYIIKGIEAPYLNKEIKSPHSNATYTFNALTDSLDLIMWS